MLEYFPMFLLNYIRFPLFPMISLPGNLWNDLRKFFPYVFQSLLCSGLGLVVGWYLVYSLRTACESHSKKSIFLLSILLFASPIIGYIFLLLLSVYQILQKHLCDYLTLGMVISILYNYTYFPKEKQLIKIVVEEVTGRHSELWVETIDISIKELQMRIAESFCISPFTRIAIESGKGTFLDDLNRSLESILNESTMTIDPLDGTVTITVYVSITEEIVETDDFAAVAGSPRAVPFYHGLLSNRIDIKYSTESYFLTAKIPFASSDAKAFYICAVEKFAAASPLQQSSHVPVKIIPWKEEDEAVASSVSENGDSQVGSPPGLGPNQKSPPKPFWRKKLKLPRIGKSIPPQQVRNGDAVVLECDEKYLSVTRGWWLSWYSPIPRRSGAFVIEIIERAPQNRIIETFNKIRRPSVIAPGPITQNNLAQVQAINPTNTQTSGTNHGPLSPNSNTGVTGAGSTSGSLGNVDDILYTGDTFRLRSLKYPDYEFGITNNRINEDHCYTGLKKIGENVTGDDWCIGVHFTFKPHSLGSQLLTTTKGLATIPIKKVQS